MKSDFEIGPPPQRRSRIVEDASQSPAGERKNVKEVSHREGEVVQTAKTSPLSSPSPVPKAQPAAPQQAAAAAKKTKSNRVVQTRGRADTMKLPVLSSLIAVEAYTHAPKALLSEIRKRNCTAFDPHGSGRVDVDVLLRWIFTNMTWLFPGEKNNAGAANLTWKGRTERANAILKEIAAEKEQGLVINRDDVTFAIGKALAMLFSNLDSQFGQLLPPALKGLTETEIQIRLLGAVEAFKATVRGELEKFTIEEKVNETQPNR